jgi:hypothetical protein
LRIGGDSPVAPGLLKQGPSVMRLYPAPRFNDMVTRCARLTIASLVLLLTLVQPAFATVTVPMRFESLVADAASIVRGEVVDVRSEWRQLRGEQVIVTVVRFKVERVLKGSASPIETLELLGGSIGETTMAVPGMPQFAVGDRDLLCLERTGTRLPVMGASQGRFRIITDRSGRDRVVFNDGRPVANTNQIGRGAVLVSTAPMAPMTLDGFESTIEQELGRARH